MFEDDKKVAIGKTSPAFEAGTGAAGVEVSPAQPTVSPGEQRPTFQWSSYPIELLIKYRDEITQCLPPLALTDMNLEEELLLQFHSLRKLQNDVLSDDNAGPLNQRAQVANSVTNALAKLVEIQADVYSQERFKMVETLLIRHLNRLPEETAAAFLADYEKVLTTAAGK